MSYSLIAHAAAGSSTGNAVTSAAIDTRGADLIVLVTARFGLTGSGSVVITDSQSNTWSPLTLYGQASGLETGGVQIFYCQSPSTSADASGTVTVTVAPVLMLATTYRLALVEVYADGSTSAPTPFSDPFDDMPYLASSMSPPPPPPPSGVPAKPINLHIGGA